MSETSYKISKMASKASSEKKRQVETGSEEEGKFTTIYFVFTS